MRDKRQSVMGPSRRRAVIGVVGGAQVSAGVAAMAHELGRLIAQRGWVLVNGGRNVGVMAASARGAKEAGGTVIGILPDATDHRAAADLDVAILTGMGKARNVINVLSSDVVIACPGSVGTLSEVMLALNHDKPVILLGGLDPGPELGRYRRSGMLRDAATPAEAVELADALLQSAQGSG